MLQQRAIWDKLGNNNSKAEPVEVVLLGFGQASNADGSANRPVAIIQDLSNNNQLRYVELRFLNIKGGIA